MRLYLKSLVLILCALIAPLSARASSGGSITITPGYETIAVSGTLQYTATVSGLSSSSVTWYVNGIPGGNSTIGTISPSGLYTAPATVPSGDVLVIALGSDHSTAAYEYVAVEAIGPAIAAITPSPVPVGNYKITLTGSGFQRGATVLAAGATLPTTFVNSSTLIVAGYQAKAGVVGLQVSNPTTLWGPVFPATFGSKSSSSPTKTGSGTTVATPPSSTIIVSPAATQVKLNGTQQFSAMGNVTWTCTAGSISSSGLYTAPSAIPSAGAVTVTATSDSGSGSATVTLVNSAVQTISPMTATVNLGTTLQFTSAGATSWTATQGSISSTGLYTPPASLPANTAVAVTATGPNGSASAQVTIATSTPQTISPTSATVTLGKTQQFTSAGATSWTASSGTVSSTGLYTAPATMPSSSAVSITASGPNGSATASVTLAAAATPQTISPTSATVTVGKTQQFTSAGATSWTASAGSVSSTGLYTAPATMPASTQVSVTATGPNGSATATVTLASATTKTPTVQTILPTSATVALGATQQFISSGATSWTATAGSVSSSGLYTAPTSMPSGASSAAVWSSVAKLPAGFSTNSGVMHSVGDGNIYMVEYSGSSPNIVTSVYVASQSSVIAGSPVWTNISGTGLIGTEWPGQMGMMPNGTLLMTESDGSSVSDVLAWNGSTTSPVWKKVTGWNGSSSSLIYNFTNDSAGYTYFSPAWSGNIWRNDAPNSLNFTLIDSNLYGQTNGGAAGHTTYGGLYQTKVWNLGDGKGDMLWACGEGELENINLGFSSWTSYLTNAQGYTGNCVGLDKSPTSILALRTADSNLDQLTSINIATRVATVLPSSNPRSTTGFPSNLNTNVVNALHWVSGSTWVLSDVDANTNSAYLLVSQDDGVTWSDITAVSGINSSCTGSNLSQGAIVAGNYVYARCQGGTSFWQYGPLASATTSAVTVTATGPNGSATATVSLAAATTTPVTPPVTVQQTIAPTSATVTLGQTQQFTSSGATSWTASAGSVSSTGLFTAPSTMPASSSVTVTATGPNGSATATVSLAAAASTQSISPTAATVVLGKTQQFTSSGATSWAASAGSVSSTGLFTAPSTMPSSTSVTVTATGPNGSATASVNLTAAAGSTGNVSISTQNPYYGWEVIPGATRRIHATVTGGATGEVSWSYTAVGGASATLTPAASPNLLGAFVDVTLGSTGSACTNVGTVLAPIFSSAANVVLTATSVDDPTKSVKVPIQVCNPPVSVYISPFNVRLYAGQKVDLQSWVWGAVNDNVTWSITSQPSGGNGAFVAPPAGGSATTNRDAVFSATVAGDYTITATSAANPSATASAILSVDSAAMPSYATTPNHTEPVDCSVDPTQSGKTYDVGAGHPYASLYNVFVAIGSNVVPAGTTIRIFNTDTTGSNPTRDHEYLRIDGQGTQAAPIRIVGCADSQGNLPIIDGANATSYSPTDNSVAAQIDGLYQISLHHSNGFGVYPNINSPSYVIIEGLAFRNAYPTTGSTNNYYYSPGSSTPTQWVPDASCIRPYEGSHVTVRGNDIEDCTFGILADFNGNNGWGGFFGDFDLQGNYFTNTGTNAGGGESQHMAYVQGFRQVIQGNVFDQLKSISSAGELKMRGVAEVVRYNFFNTSTNTRTIDFVEEQDSNEYMSFLGYYYPVGGTSFASNYPSDAYTPDLIAAGDEAWHKVYAYGNIVNFGPNTPDTDAPIHFFGDQSPYTDQNTNPPVRVGNLFDYSNTFYSVGGGTSSPPNFNLVDTMQNQDNQIRWEWPTLTLWNNAVYTGPLNTTANQGFQWSTLRSDVYNFGPNWVSSNWGNNTQTCTNTACWAGTGWPYYEETTQYMDGGNLPAHITGFSNVIVGGSTPPFSTTTFVPTAGGGLVGAGGALPSTISNMPVRFQISAPSYTLTPRTSPNTLGGHD